MWRAAAVIMGIYEKMCRTVSDCPDEQTVVRITRSHLNKILNAYEAWKILVKIPQPETPDANIDALDEKKPAIHLQHDHELHNVRLSTLSSHDGQSFISYGSGATEQPLIPEKPTFNSIEEKVDQLGEVRKLDEETEKTKGLGSGATEQSLIPEKWAFTSIEKRINQLVEVRELRKATKKTKGRGTTKFGRSIKPRSKKAKKN